LSYTPFIDAGRATGKQTPVKNLYDWLEFNKYGIEYETDKERWGIAWAIAKTHAKEGSFKFRGNQTDVFAQVIAQAKPTLLQALTDSSVTKFESEVLKEIKRINDIAR
jgi:hypothetical protein